VSNPVVEAMQGLFGPGSGWSLPGRALSPTAERQLQSAASQSLAITNVPQGAVATAAPVRNWRAWMVVGVIGAVGLGFVGYWFFKRRSNETTLVGGSDDGEDEPTVVSNPKKRKKRKKKAAR
jgi:hypothetical protein